MRRKSVREIIRYPTLAITPQFNPCDHKTPSLEHLLGCGHLIITPEPDAPCAPNCHYFEHEKNATSRQSMLDNMDLMKLFYCNACVEQEIEGEIPENLSSKAAERHRIQSREIKATEGQKRTKYRKCYIAQKFITVPCDEEGNTTRNYDPFINMHPYDTAWPPTGTNMFEDIEVTPRRHKEPKRRKLSRSADSSIVSLDMSDVGVSYANDESSEDIEETLAEEACWLDEQEDLASRGAEAATPSPRRRRAAARPIINSSSPRPPLSSPVQVPVAVIPPAPQGPMKKRSGKMKRKAQGETVIAPALQPAKPLKVPKARSNSGSKQSLRSSSAAVLPTKAKQRSGAAISRKSTSSVLPSAKKTKTPVRPAAATRPGQQHDQSCNVL